MKTGQSHKVKVSLSVHIPERHKEGVQVQLQWDMPVVLYRIIHINGKVIPLQSRCGREGG